MGVGYELFRRADVKGGNKSMKLTRNLGMLVLSIWLILSGLVHFGLSFPNEAVVLALLAIAAGVLILLGRPG
jgi:hypothetical protein